MTLLDLIISQPLSSLTVLVSVALSWPCLTKSVRVAGSIEEAEDGGGEPDESGQE